MNNVNNVNNVNVKVNTRNIDNAIDKLVVDCSNFALNESKRLCPVKTGKLRDSISTETTGIDSFDISTDCGYGYFVEMGTEKISPSGFLRSTLDHLPNFIKER